MADQKHPNDEQAPIKKLPDVEYHIKEAFKIPQDETTRLRQEQEAFDAMSKKLEHVHFSSTVKFNVGGHTFTTSVQTLTKDPNSMLAAMFSGKFDTKPAEAGAFFIDRDGTHFRFTLNYLRTGKLTLPEGATFLKELAEEAEFYQIQGIIDELKSPESAVQASKPSDPFEDSEILTNEHRRILIGWLTAHRGEWRLLYRASRDGFRAATFHARCDNKGPTVTIVKSGNNIFGGFTEVSWQSEYCFFMHFTRADDTYFNWRLLIDLLLLSTVSLHNNFGLTSEVLIFINYMYHKSYNSESYRHATQG